MTRNTEERDVIRPDAWYDCIMRTSMDRMTDLELADDQFGSRQPHLTIREQSAFKESTRQQQQSTKLLFVPSYSVFIPL